MLTECATLTPISVIDADMNDLSNAQSVLMGRIEVLRGKMINVLLPATDLSAHQKEDGKSRPCCPLSESIRTQIGVIHSIQDLVNDTIERLEA